MAPTPKSATHVIISTQDVRHEAADKYHTPAVLPSPAPSIDLLSLESNASADSTPIQEPNHKEATIQASMEEVPATSNQPRTTPLLQAPTLSTAPSTPAGDSARTTQAWASEPSTPTVAAPPGLLARVAPADLSISLNHAPESSESPTLDDRDEAFSAVLVANQNLQARVAQLTLELDRVRAQQHREQVRQQRVVLTRATPLRVVSATSALSTTLHDIIQEAGSILNIDLNDDILHMTPTFNHHFSNDFRLLFSQRAIEVAPPDQAASKDKLLLLMSPLSQTIWNRRHSALAVPKDSLQSKKASSVSASKAQELASALIDATALMDPALAQAWKQASLEFEWGMPTQGQPVTTSASTSQPARASSAAPSRKLPTAERKSPSPAPPPPPLVRSASTNPATSHAATPSTTPSPLKQPLSYTSSSGALSPSSASSSSSPWKSVVVPHGDGSLMLAARHSTSSNLAPPAAASAHTKPVVAKPATPFLTRSSSPPITGTSFVSLAERNKRSAVRIDTIRSTPPSGWVKVGPGGKPVTLKPSQANSQTQKNRVAKKPAKQPKKQADTASSTSTSASQPQSPLLPLSDALQPPSSDGVAAPAAASTNTPLPSSTSASQDTPLTPTQLDDLTTQLMPHLSLGRAAVHSLSPPIEDSVSLAAAVFQNPDFDTEEEIAARPTSMVTEEGSHDPPAASAQSLHAPLLSVLQPVPLAPPWPHGHGPSWQVPMVNAKRHFPGPRSSLRSGQPSQYQHMHLAHAAKVHAHVQAQAHAHAQAQMYLQYGPPPFQLTPMGPMFPTSGSLQQWHSHAPHAQMQLPPGYHQAAPAPVAHSPMLLPPGTHQHHPQPFPFYPQAPHPHQIMHPQAQMQTAQAQHGRINNTSASSSNPHAGESAPTSGDLSRQPTSTEMTKVQT
jgi:hypothetical protein